MLAAARDDAADHELNAELCHELGSVLELLLYPARLGHDPEALPLERGLGAALDARAHGEWACGVVAAARRRD